MYPKKSIALKSLSSLSLHSLQDISTLAFHHNLTLLQGIKFTRWLNCIEQKVLNWIILIFAQRSESGDRKSDKKYSRFFHNLFNPQKYFIIVIFDRFVLTKYVIYSAQMFVKVSFYKKWWVSLRVLDYGHLTLKEEKLERNEEKSKWAAGFEPTTSELMADCDATTACLLSYMRDF